MTPKHSNADLPGSPDQLDSPDFFPSSRSAIKCLTAVADSEIAQHSSRFFKTGPGEYGEGDQFLGIRVPVLRSFVRKFRGISLDDIDTLLHSPFHELRLFALLSCVDSFKRGTQDERDAIYHLYIQRTSYINNWDMVDISAPHIVGAYLVDRDRQVLYDFARSSYLWERRISILSTFHFIRNNEFDDVLEISRILVNDPQDLIHKAVGWMLREVGKRAPLLERNFLKENYGHMPRTMLRYAIERFPPDERQMYLRGMI